MRTYLRATAGLAICAQLFLASSGTVRAQSTEPAKTVESGKTETGATPAAAKTRRTADGTKDRAFTIPSAVTLTSEQQAKLDTIKKEQASKILDLSKKLDGVLTNEQKAARKEASTKAKTQGLKGKEARTFVDNELKLTDEQKKKRTEWQSELSALRANVREQIHGMLTDTQKEHYKLRKPRVAASST